MDTRGTTSALARDAAAQLNERGYAILERLAEPAVMDQLLAEVKPWADRAERLQLKFFGGGLRKVESVLTKSRAIAIPVDILSELNQLEKTSAARAAAASEDDREMLEVVARSQSRHLVSHVLEGEHADLAVRFRQLRAEPPEHG